MSCSDHSIVHVQAVSARDRARVLRGVWTNAGLERREYVNTEELWTKVVQPRGGSQIVVNGELFKLRQGGLMGYYPDFIFPRLAEARKRMMPQMVTAYYLRVFRGPPIGALYRAYPGPWQVRAVCAHVSLFVFLCFFVPFFVTLFASLFASTLVCSVRCISFSQSSVNDAKSCTFASEVYAMREGAVLTPPSTRLAGFEGGGDQRGGGFLPGAVGGGGRGGL